MAMLTDTYPARADTYAQVEDLSKRVLLRESKANAPLFSRLAGGAAVNAEDLIVNWRENTFRPTTGVVNSDIDSDDTNILVSDATIFVTGDIIQVRGYNSDGSTLTFEQLLVTDMTDGSASIMVTRLYGSEGTGLTLSQGYIINILGNTVAQGGEAPRGIYTALTTNSNYIQRFVTVLEVANDIYRNHIETIHSGGMHKTKYDSELDKQWKEHIVRIEKMLLFGRPNAPNSTNAGKASLRGIYGFLSDAGTTLDYGGSALSEEVLISMVASGVGLGMDTSKIVMFGNIVAWKRMNAWAASRERWIQDGKATGTIGSRITQYITPWGRIAMVENIQMVDPYSASRGEIIVFQSDHVKLRPVRNTGARGYKQRFYTRNLSHSEFICSELTLEFRNANCGFRIRNFI